MGIARFTRIVAGGLNTAGQRPFRVFETGYVIALPAVHRDRQTIELAQCLLDINTYCGEALFRQFPGLFQLSGHAQSSFVCRFE